MCRSSALTDVNARMRRSRHARDIDSFPGRNAMDASTRAFVEALLEGERDLTLATLRPDGSPQANTVSYASDGLTVYFGTARDSQKVRNLTHCPKAAVPLEAPYPDWGAIKAVSMGGTATVMPDDAPDIAHAMALLAAKFPQLQDLATPPDLAAVAFVKFVPDVISVLDYSKGFGHT